MKNIVFIILMLVVVSCGNNFQCFEKKIPECFEKELLTGKQEEEPKSILDEKSQKTISALCTMDRDSLVVVFYNPHYTLASTLKEEIQNLLTTNSMGCSIEKGMIVLNDYPKNVVNAIQILEEFDKPTPELLINVEIIECYESAYNELEINFLYQNDMENRTKKLESKLQFLQQNGNAKIIYHAHTICMNNHSSNIAFKTTADTQKTAAELNQNPFTLDIKTSIMGDQKIRVTFSGSINTTVYSFPNEKQLMGIYTMDKNSQVIKANPLVEITKLTFLQSLFSGYYSETKHSVVLCFLKTKVLWPKAKTKGKIKQKIRML
jgi:hypothetical protein